MDERPMDPESDAIIADLVAAGLVSVGTDADGHETWTLTELGVQVSNQMAMSGEDDGLAQLLYCACGLRMRGETQVRRGRESEWRYYRCPGRRDGRCGSTGWRVRAEDIEALVLDHLAAHRTPPEELPYLREELARLTHLPDDGLRGRRARIETAMKRLGDRYTWQELGEAEYRAERKRLEAMLVELPVPAESNLVAFDRAAALYEEIGAILADTTREHQRQIVLAIVETVKATEGGVSEIRVRPEARPFFADYVASGTAATEDEAAPQRAAVGCWRPRTVLGEWASHDALAWYAGPPDGRSGSWVRGAGLSP